MVVVGGHRAVPARPSGMVCRVMPTSCHTVPSCRSCYAITVLCARGMAQGTARGPLGQLEGTVDHRAKLVPDAIAGQ